MAAGGDLNLATSGDLNLATSGDFYMATDTTCASEDAASEALVRAYVRWPRLRDLPHRDAWVLRTAINVALRANGKHRRWLPDQPHVRQVSADEAAVDRLVVAEAVRTLSARQREAVTLRYLCDVSESDTASVMHLSVGALKSHLDRARRKLRATLDPPVAKEIFDAD